MSYFIYKGIHFLRALLLLTKSYLDIYNVYNKSKEQYLKWESWLVKKVTGVDSCRDNGWLAR